MPDTPAARAQWLADWVPFRTLTNLVRTVGDTWRIADETRTALTRLETHVADNSEFLNGVADDMARLTPAITSLVEENTRLNAQVAEFTGEDVRESAATENVRTRWNAIAERFTSTPEVPDVDPLPAPGDGDGAPVEPTV
jgi:chromosome segregation ATPase